MIFLGAGFCSHCGAKAERTDTAAGAAGPCPRCGAELKAVLIGNTNLQECARCAGIWADTAALQQICVEREKQSAVLGLAAPLPTAETADFETKIRYLPCPVCGKLMNRVNFANCSHVIVDVCGAHGTWFDKDELRRMVEFIRQGGLEQARQRARDELEELRRKLTAEEISRAWDVLNQPSGFDYGDRHLGVSFAASVLKSLLK
jgi:Zn-finger nucleic acid-binding protein